MPWPDKWIIHCDINGHFCYSSLIYYPQLRDLPVVVGGNEESRHGIVLSKNKEAKTYKIQTASTLAQARQLCPALHVLPPAYALYERTSKDFYRFLDAYSPISAPFGCDGKSIDVTNTARLFGGGPRSRQGVEAIVRALHEEFPRQYGLELSIGVSWNFAFAKLACDTAGPNGVRWIVRESPQDTDWQNQVYSMPVEELIYIGEATRKKLNAKGVRTIGEMAECGPERLQGWLGVVGREHYIRAVGKDESPLVAQDGGPLMRTIGNGSTTPYDLTREEHVHAMTHVLASSVCQRMRAHKVVPRTVEASITYAMEGELKSESYQCPMAIPSNLDTEFADAALQLLLRKFGLRYPIRKLTLRGKDLAFNTSVYQLSFECGALRRERAMALADCADRVNQRWGQSLRRCVELVDPRVSGLGTKPNQRFAPSGWY